MIAATAIAIGAYLGTWHKDSNQVESAPNAYAIVSVMGQSLAVGTMRRNNAWFGWRGESPSTHVLGVPVRAAVTLGATVDRVPTYAVLERDWRLTMLSADRLTSRPHGRRSNATLIGHKTVTEPLAILSVGAEVIPGWTVWLSKSDSVHLSIEWSTK